VLVVKQHARSALDQFCTPLALEPAAGMNKASFFRILPAYRFRSEGDAVEQEDIVLFYNPKANQVTVFQLGFMLMNAFSICTLAPRPKSQKSTSATSL